LDGVILDAALAAVAELGYDRLTMDDLASRAGVGKAAIYRRWSSKAVVVAEAIAHWRRGRGPDLPPDTGTLRGDLDELVSAVPDYSETDVNTIKVIVGVATAAMRDAVLAAAIDDLVLVTPRHVLGTVLDRAVRRGEIPAGRDLSMVPDVALGLNIVRMITGRPIDRLFVRRVLDDVILPLATAPLTDGSH
jgi:AcrR family transcriptional regulator